MILFFVFLIFILTVGVISYPLFFIKLQRYSNNSFNSEESNSNFWLSALSDLNEDYKLGRISKSDYEKQKIIIQRNYLNSIKK